MYTHFTIFPCGLETIGGGGRAIAPETRKETL
jgi:hypothetical protein